MSEMATMLNTGLLAYLASHAQPEDDFLKNLKAAARAAQLPPIWISPEQGVFIQILLRLCAAKNVVEVGTQTGYSAIVMARALPAGGRVTTIDNDPEAVAFARPWIADSDVGERIELRLGDGLQHLRELPEQGFDAVFIDADKEHYPHYLQEAVRLTRPGGMILVDNAFAYGQVLDEQPARKKDDVWAIRAFNQLMARQPGLDGIIVPIGDGMWVSVRSRPEG